MTSLTDVKKLINKGINDFSSTEFKNHTNNYNNFVVEVNSKLPNFATKSDLNLYVPLSKYTSESSQYALKSDIKPFPDFSQFALKTDIKPTDTSQFALKSDIKPQTDTSQFYSKNQNVNMTKPYVLEFGSGETKEVSAGKIGYKTWSDGLDIVGANSSGTTGQRKVKIWDKLDVDAIDASNITVKGNLTNQKGEKFLLDNDAKSQFALKSDIKPFPDVSQYALKSEIKPFPDITQYALKSEIKTLTDTNQFVSKNQNIPFSKQYGLDFGDGEKKHIDAGKIRYKSWSDGLDIIGAGEDGKARKVKIWDSLDTGNIQANNIQLPNKSVMEFGSGETKEVSAGRIGYKTWSDGLDIVGANASGTTGQRKVKIWDKLDTDVIDVTDINVRGKLSNTSGDKYLLENAAKSQFALKSDIKPFPDVSQYALKSDIKSFPDVSQFALKSDLKLIPDASQFINKNENIQLPKKVQIELGSDDVKTPNRINDGKIVYKGWSNGLDIVGVSDGVSPARNVRIWDALNTGLVQANNIQLPNKSVMEFGSGEVKEVSAGKIGYKTWSDGLDIIGANASGTAGQRKVRVWDKLDTDVIDVTDINVRGVLKDKFGNKYVNVKDLNEKQPVCRNIQTELNDDGKGSALFLDRHNLECKPNEYLNSFRLSRNPEGTKMQWVGKCCSNVW